jgi:hypothetical protein
MPIKPNRTVIAGAYAVALLLVLVPVSEMLLRVWPLRVTEASWRFGAIGLFSNALLTPLLGLTFAGMLAFLFGHRRAVRTLSVVLIAGAIVLASSMAVFALDALQMRGNVAANAQTAFDVASAQALLKLGLFVTVGAVLGIGGWRSTTGRGSRRQTREPIRGLVRPLDAAPEAAEPATPEAAEPARAGGAAARE